MKVENFKNPLLFWPYLLELAVEIWWSLFLFFQNLANKCQIFHKIPLYVSKSYFSGWEMRKFAEGKKKKPWLHTIINIRKQGILNTLQFQHKLYYLLKRWIFQKFFFPPPKKTFRCMKIIVFGVFNLSTWNLQN